MDELITENDHIKPYPFCGAMPKKVIHMVMPIIEKDGRIIESRAVECVNKYNNCMCMGNIENSRKNAIIAWNRRA